MEELADMPDELLMHILLRCQPESISDLASASSRVAAILDLPEFRYKWLRHRRVSFHLLLRETDYQMHYRLVKEAWDLSPTWAIELYHEMSLYVKINVIDYLLSNRQSWPIAIRLVKSQKDDIFEKHLKWRFFYAEVELDL